MSTPSAALAQSIGPEDLVDSASAEDLRVILQGSLSDDEVRNVLKASDGTSFPGQPAELRYQLLRFLIDDDRNRLKLQALDDLWPELDRGGAVLRLWQFLVDHDLDYLKGVRQSSVYHQRRLFEWFVDQYDLVRARQVYTRRGVLYSGLQHVPLLGVGLAFLMADNPMLAMLTVVAGYVLPAGIWSIVRGGGKDTEAAGGRRLAALDFFQSLVPRLAGTAAAGTALMLSSEKLMGFLRTDEKARALPLLLLIPALLYLVLEIQQRVRPRLRWRELTRRVANIVFLALPHAAGIIFFVLPVIRHSLGIAGLSPEEIFRFTMAVFTAGLVLNVIWAEEPVTRPL